MRDISSASSADQIPEKASNGESSGDFAIAWYTANVKRFFDGSAIANHQLSFALELHEITEFEPSISSHTIAKTAC